MLDLLDLLGRLFLNRLLVLRGPGGNRDAGLGTLAEFSVVMYASCTGNLGNCICGGSLRRIADGPDTSDPFMTIGAPVTAPPGLTLRGSWVSPHACRGGKGWDSSFDSSAE
jgi:hypothetical protein